MPAYGTQHGAWGYFFISFYKINLDGCARENVIWDMILSFY